jgi:hypothetical protein
MACESFRQTPQQTAQQRKEEIKERLKELERKLKSKMIKLGISPNGAIVFKGWKTADRGGISDACAFRKLSAEGSYEFRKAILEAESQQGRKVNINAINSGEHSHSDGADWHPGHGHGEDE